jgi:uncharacterized protein YneF (UPF0154 family)
MSKEIIISFLYTKEVALKASKLYYDWDMKNSSKKYIGWFFIGMLQFAIVGALKHNVYGLLFISTLLLIYWYYGRWYIRKPMLMRFYNNSPLKDKKVEIIANKSGLKFNNQLIEWKNIKKLLELDSGILIQSEFYTFFFDKNSFKSNNDLKLFLNYLN